MRHLNKLVGRPATPETAILAAMVSDLRDAAQRWLGDPHSVTAAVLSSPDRIRLTDEELDDIFDYLKLRNLMTECDDLEYLYATSAAYAGYGHGLCPTYTDTHACEREECEFEYHDVLHVDFNRESLSGTINLLRSFRRMSTPAHFVDFDLGYVREETRLAVADTSDEDESGGMPYWSAVSARIRELVSSYHRPIDQLLLTGPLAANPRFKAAVSTALRELFDQEVLAVLVSEHDDEIETEAEGAWQELFDFATSWGAAEVAKRRQEGPVGCRQTDECRQRREREHQRQPALQAQGLDAAAYRYEI